MPYVDFNELELLALHQVASGESSDPEALKSAQAKIESFLAEPVESTFSDEYGKGDGETIPGGGYDVELVVYGSTESDPVSPEEGV